MIGPYAAIIFQHRPANHTKPAAEARTSKWPARTEEQWKATSLRVRVKLYPGVHPEDDSEDEMFKT